MARRRTTEGSEMPFLDHLEELRWRIIYSLGAVLIAMAIGFFVVFKFDVVGLMAQPILPLLPPNADGTHTLIYTHPGDGFSIMLNAAMIVGGVLAFPVVLYQVWAFLAPGLY